MTTMDLLNLPVRETFVSPKSGITLTVVGGSYGVTDDIEGVLSGRVPRVEMRGSQDGRSFLTQWHEGPESGVSVWVEVWTTDGCRFHGTVDSVSRRITQVG